jgi:hypothetical protein
MALFRTIALGLYRKSGVKVIPNLIRHQHSYYQEPMLCEKGIQMVS